MDNEEEKILLPHHEQQNLCTTRLPYRQGRKLTAVKAYSITRESNHLLVFGVPSLNLRQETKALFINFGKLLQFTISTQHPAEAFTETYHAHFDKIQSARLAKRMLDTKNFYGGSLHICYAPELESITETQQKLLQRQRDVVFRLKNLNNQTLVVHNDPVVMQNATNTERVESKLNMGVINTISIHSKKRKKHDCKTSKRSLLQEVSNNDDEMFNLTSNLTSHSQFGVIKHLGNELESNVSDLNKTDTLYNVKSNRNINIVPDNISVNNTIEIVDCTSVDKETITNINEHLNYNKFGNEIVRKIPVKPLNRIKFSINKS